MNGKAISFMMIGGVLAGLIGAGIGYVLFNAVWWLWGTVVVPIFAPQNAFIYQGPPDPGHRLWWIIGGAVLAAARGVVAGYSRSEKKTSISKQSQNARAL